VVAGKARQWNTCGNIGLVVGATCPDELKLIREAHPDMPLLIPGVGAQGGDLELAVRYGVDARGEKAVINSSRQVIYASKGEDFAAAAREAASSLRERINSCRAGRTSG
jgi:orotidine-5'-phosphate decarboxylase